MYGDMFAPTSGMIILLIFILLLAIAYTVFWIIALVRSAQRNKWVWFVLMLLLFSPLWIVYALIYGLGKKKKGNKK